MLGRRIFGPCTIDAWVGEDDDFIVDMRLVIANVKIDLVSLLEKISAASSNLESHHIGIRMPSTPKDEDWTALRNILSALVSLLEDPSIKTLPRRISFLFSEVSDYDRFLDLIANLKS